MVADGEWLFARDCQVLLKRFRKEQGPFGNADDEQCVHAKWRCEALILCLRSGQGAYRWMACV